MIPILTPIDTIRHLIRVIPLIIVLTLSQHAFGQGTVVTGKVTGTNGEAISGATVQVKGTKKGIATDNNGNFSLNVTNLNSTLVVSSSGYNRMEVSLNGRSNVPISLTSSSTQLEQVVVIGYGTANKRDLTGSIAKVSGKEVADKPNTNPVASLQGKVAGLSVVNNGTPGAAPDIRIRGTVSIGQVHPLYVVDGIFNDNIDYINPNDIESIEILKDPSSLAIFGVKGATGVIAITTKKAKAGQTIINFSSNYGFKKLVDKIKFVNGEQFKTLFAEERAEDASNPTTTPYNYTGLTANTDWIDAVTRTGRFNNNNLSISSSTDKNRFNFGLGYYSDQGIIKHQQLEKYLLSFNDELNLYKGVKVGANLNISRQLNPYDVTEGGTDVLNTARKAVPLVSSGTKNFAVRNPYGQDTINTDLYSGLNVGLQSAGVVNPLVQLENEWNKRKSLELRGVGSAYFEITFLKYLNFRATYYADVSNTNTRRYFPKYYDYDPVTNTPVLVSQTTALQQDNNDYKKYQQDYILNFKKSFGSNNLTLTGGFTTYYFGNFNRSGKVSENPLQQPIPNDSRFWYLTNGFEDPSTKTASSSQSEYSTVSYLARALYNYKSKYYLNASFRNDASSRLPSKNRNQKFWAVGAAWDLTKESFMANQNIFDFLKIKGSIGVLGNQSASQLDGTPINYPAYPYLLTGTNAPFGTNIFSAAKKAYVENPDLKWETVSAQEIGIELNAFKNSLHFEANYYNKTTKNLLTYVSRATLGLPDELINGGSIRNWGEEFAASWNRNLSKDLILNVSGNITFQKNKVLSLSKDLPTGFLSRAFQNNGSAESRTIPGYPIGSFYGYIQEGIYQDTSDISKSPNAGSIGTYRPGDIKFKDINGPEGKGPDGKITADDRTIIGNPNPNFTYGASVGLTYKGISLGVDVNGVHGNKIFRTWGTLESPFQRVNYTADQLNRWHGAGTSNRVPILGQGDRFNYNGSTYNLENGSYFRIRNIQLGYNFPQRVLSGARIKGLRIYANVQNLKTFKDNMGYTTEYGGDATAFGYDNGGGAIPVSTTFGLNVTF